MNIFEALNEGKGRATLPEKRQHWVTMFITSDFRYNFVWSNDVLHGVFDIELRSNDWTPYVPPEERKIEGMVAFKNPWTVYRSFVNELKRMGYNDDFIEKFVVKPNVPRETCYNCGYPSYAGKKVKLTSDYKCVECGRGDIFEVVPPPKTKQTKVFENVKWDAYPSATKSNCLTVSTSFDATKGGTKGMSFANKPPMKMTLEWEE